MDGLRDMVALVLGGTGGLGVSITRRLAAEGCRVFATFNSESGLQRSQTFPHPVTMIRTDTTDERQVQILFDTLIGHAQRVHIVINTIGGYLPQKPLTEVTLEEWDQMMSINLTSAFLSTREALRRMTGQSFGRIINISAMLGVRPLPERIPYAVAKASVSLLTELVAQEVKGTGITVNAIAPSVIATSANLASMTGEASSQGVTRDQIADIICYLCSPAAGAVNGTTIRAFGGL